MNTLFLSMSRFPEGNGADVIRLQNLVNLFKACGHCICVISRGECTNFKEREIGEISYCSFRSRHNNVLVKIKDIFLYKSYLSRFISKSNNKWDCIVIHGVPNNTFKYIKKYCKKRNIQLICDCVEWYSKKEFLLRGFSYQYRSKDKLMKKLIDKEVQVITISTYLENYYMQKGIKAVRIPVILDLRSIPCYEKVLSDKMNFIYAGSPGGKDYLNVILKGFSLLSEQEKAKFKFKIIGVTWEWIQRHYHYSNQQIEELQRYVQAYGRMERIELYTHLINADFSVLLRPEELRYAKAGFPTKIVESLAWGTPVICNITSDLGMYVKDNFNGKIVEDCDASSFCKVIQSALRMEISTRIKMSKNAKKSAEKDFDYHKYLVRLKELLKDD